MAKYITRAVLCAVGLFALLILTYAVNPPLCGTLLFIFCIAALCYVLYALIDVARSNKRIEKILQRQE